LKWAVVSRREFNLPPEVAGVVWEQIIDRLEIFAWKTHYAASDLHVQISDGESWKVLIRDGEKVRTIEGENAYPALCPLGEATLEVVRDTRRH
jgi:hypothetical protein